MHHQRRPLYLYRSVMYLLFWILLVAIKTDFIYLMSYKTKTTDLLTDTHHIEAHNWFVLEGNISNPKSYLKLFM